MKKLTAISLFLFFLIQINVKAQETGNTHDLIGSLAGKWKVIRYQPKGQPMLHSNDTIIFDREGVFIRKGTGHFGNRRGFYRTDETRSVVIIEINESITEWAASLKRGVLRLRSVPASLKPKVYITLVRLPEQV